MTLLQVESLYKRRADRQVLAGVDLDVPAGRVIALLGPSGCGKTTLLRLIAGFDAADQGRIVLDGRVLEGPGAHLPAERRRIGYVPQEGTLFPHLTVAGNVGFGLTRAQRRDGLVTEALALTELAGLDRRYPHQLSGGQQQRTALARALAPRPALVLLDEPFSGLDLALRRAVCADVVAVLRRQRATAILVTHDPQEAFASADLVAVMERGRIAQCASPATLYRQPASLAVAALTGAALVLDGLADADRAQTALGPVALQAPAAGRVRVMVRPDQIMLVPPGQGTALDVVSSAFRGDHSLVTVRAGASTLDLPLSLPGELPDRLQLRIEGRCMAYGAE